MNFPEEMRTNEMKNKIYKIRKREKRKLNKKI